MRGSIRSLAFAAAFAAAAVVGADGVVGKAAPAFAVPDTSGAVHDLSQYQGKLVVLEWVNYDCPFVMKHYGSGNMQSLQKEYTGKGVVWLSINSSAAGKQGNFAPEKARALSEERGAAHTAYLLDPAGDTGRAYGAKTTPHMYVIDPHGRLVYAGGIDDKPSTDVADIPVAKNYVRAALDSALAGEPIETATSPPYGCAVKY